MGKTGEKVSSGEGLVERHSRAPRRELVFWCWCRGSSCGGNADQGQDKTPPGSSPDPVLVGLRHACGSRRGLIRHVFAPGGSLLPRPPHCCPIQQGA